MINNIPVDRKNEIEELNNEITKLKSTVNTNNANRLVGINTSNLIKTLTGTTSTNGASWTATQDCYAIITVGAYKQTYTYQSTAYIDDVEIAKAPQPTDDYETPSNIVIVPMKKGQVLKLKLAISSATCKASIYGLKL
jgi:hypothetical protein